MIHIISMGTNEHHNMESNLMPPCEDSKESVKLTKNAKGIFQWEIKLKEDQVFFDTLTRLTILNKEMESQFGTG